MQKNKHSRETSSTMIQCVPKPNVVAASRRRPQQHKLNELEQSRLQRKNHRAIDRMYTELLLVVVIIMIVAVVVVVVVVVVIIIGLIVGSEADIDEVSHIHRHLLDLRVVQGLSVLQGATVINRRLIFHGRTLPLSTLLLNGSS